MRSILSFDVDLICSLPLCRGRNVIPRLGERAALLQRGPHVAAKIDMFETSSANLIGGFVFGSIGFVAFIYGKRMNLWKIMVCGLALMIFPYFIADNRNLVRDRGAWNSRSFLPA